MVKVMGLLSVTESALGFSFGVRAPVEMKVWCMKSMYMLKVVSGGSIEGLNLFHLNHLIVFGWFSHYFCQLTARLTQTKLIA